MLHFKDLSKLITLSLISLLTGSCVFAARPGFYLGGQLGYGYVHNSGISIVDMEDLLIGAFGNSNFSINSFNGNTSDPGFVWRVYGGYQIGYNWAMEIGWSQYPQLPVDATATGVDRTTDLVYSANTRGIYKVDAFDLLGKYIYVIPCFPRVNIFGKLGLAYVSGRSSATVFVSGFSNFFAVNTTARVYPTFSLGVTYDLRQEISADLSYTRIQKVGNSDQLGSMDALMLSMALHFG